MQAHFKNKIIDLLQISDSVFATQLVAKLPNGELGNLFRKGCVSILDLNLYQRLSRQPEVGGEGQRNTSFFLQYICGGL